MVYTGNCTYKDNQRAALAPPHACPAIAINKLIVPGVAISKVEIIPIKAYANAQNGKASGSLYHKNTSPPQSPGKRCIIPLHDLPTLGAV